VERVQRLLEEQVRQHRCPSGARLCCAVRRAPLPRQQFNDRQLTAQVKRVDTWKDAGPSDAHDSGPDLSVPILCGTLNNNRFRCAGAHTWLFKPFS
jgi:hypothetical protein